MDESVETHSQDYPQRTPVSFPQPARPKKKVGVKIAILIVLLLLIGGVVWVLIGSENPFSGSTTTPTPTIALHELPTNTPSPTPQEVNKEDLKVSILNGTGVPGEAALLQKEFEKLGFKIIETGNADNKNYTKTEVSFSTRVSDDVKTDITAKLQGLYTDVTVSDTIPTGTDIKVITGLRKGQKSLSGSPTPTIGSKTPTPTVKATTGTPTGTSTKTPTPTQ